MGFEELYDYKLSKADWLARGLPGEGSRAGDRRAIDFATKDVATCGLDDRVGEVKAAVAETPFGFALVLSCDGMVVGRLRRAVLEGSPEARAEEVMELGPSTSRPDTAPEKLLQKLRDRDFKTAVLSDPEGRFLGVVRRDSLERAGRAA